MRMWCKAAVVAMMGAQAAVCVAQGPTLTAERRRDLELRPGVVEIYVPLQATIPSMNNFKCGIRISGTGFLYRSDGYLITNGHVVQIANAKDQDARNERVKEVVNCLTKEAERRTGQPLTAAQSERLAGEARKGVLVSPAKLTVVLDNGMHYDGEIKAFSDPMTENGGGKDVAIIKVAASNLPTVPLGNSDTVNGHDRVFVIGYPGAADISNTSMLTASVTEGIISARKEMDNTGVPLLQTDANINHGNSGGPAFDSSGKAIGIATLGSEAGGFNFLIPINTAMEFVRQAGAEPQHDAGLFDKTWKETLDAYQNKQWSKAHRLANNALEMMPGEPQVLQVQLWAAANERSETMFERLTEDVSQPMLIGIVVLLLLAIGGVVLIKMKSSSAKTVAMASASPQVLVPPPTVRMIESIPERSPTAAKTFGSLLVANGPMMGNRFPIPKAGLLIGRDPSRCAIVVSDDTVSSEHAWVVPLDNGVAVIDKNSSNGTYINSTDSPRINKVVLKHGDRIFLGTKNPISLTYFSE